MMTSSIIKRILVVDDHPMMRAGLSMRIAAESGMEVCGEAATEDDAFALAKSTKPDLLIVDISLKTGNGIELVKRVRALDPKQRILVISAFDESLYAERALRAGALGYLNKQESNDRLIDAVSTVLRGERYLSDAMTKRFVDNAIVGHLPDQNPIEKLTDRELEIFRLIGQGKSSGSIADELYLSTHTIDTHREKIKRKLNLKTAAELSRAAMQWTLENG